MEPVERAVGGVLAQRPAQLTGGYAESGGLLGEAGEHDANPAHRSDRHGHFVGVRRVRGIGQHRVLQSKMLGHGPTRGLGGQLQFDTA